MSENEKANHKLAEVNAKWKGSKLRIALIVMPFNDVRIPSLGMAQIQSVLKNEYRDKIDVEILYLNYDFAKHLGLDFYQCIGCSVESDVTGIREWFFRKAAFPDIADNADRYFRRYYTSKDEGTQKLKRLILEKREGIAAFLDTLVDKHHLMQSDIIGMSSMFTQNLACFAMARTLKQRDPSVTVVIGGANCETPMGQEIVKNVECIDFVFSGPALKSFPKFVGCYLEGERSKCYCIDGVFSKKNCGASFSPAAVAERSDVLKGEKVGMIGEELDIDTEIELDYRVFLDHVENYFPNLAKEAHVYFETSRGCWWGERGRCKFCGLNDLRTRFRAMSPGKAIEQFKALFEYYPECYLFSAADNAMPKSYLTDVFPALEAPPDIAIFYEVRPNLTDSDLQILSKAGVRRIGVGIESLATSSLKLMNKGTSAFRNIMLLKGCLMSSVHIGWNLLVGFPGEVEEVYEKYVRDLPLLAHLPPPTGVYPISYDRYSTYFDEAERYGLDLHPTDFYGLAYPFDESVLANLAYHFYDPACKPDSLLVLSEYIDEIKQSVDLWLNKWSGVPETLPPRLFFKVREDSTVVYDSRSGEVIEHTLEDVEKRVLEKLSSPTSKTDLEVEFSGTPGLDPDKTIAFLEERGLLFREEDRFLSLILPKEPPPLSSAWPREILRV